MTTNQTPQGQTNSTRPGQMTAVMRAVAATGPKVLRIGVVQGGRVNDERIIKKRTHVTIGSNEKNLFVLSSGKVPPSFRLFELVGDDYYLNFLDGMTGRVALPTGIADLEVLKGQAKRTPQGAYQVRLTEDSRGKVVIDDTTFLFQFVAPPPVQPKPQLPVSVLRGASSIDWNTTIIAAFSFLLHFLALGAIYSDWFDPIVDDEVSVAGLVDSIKALPPPPAIEEQPTEPTEPAEADKGEVKKEEPKKATPSAGSPGPQGGPSTGSGQLSEQQAAALSNEMAQLEMAMIGALTNSGPATAGVLKNGEIGFSALDAAAQSAAGVGVGTGDLKLGSGGGTVRPGTTGGGLASIGTTGRATGTEGTGTAAVVSGPKGNANTGAASVAGGSIPNAARVVAGMRAGFRNCYNKGLQENPDAQGSIKLTIKVGPGGEVSGVTATPSGNLPASVVACVQARARSAQFDPPEGGSAVVNVPVTFVKQ